jgi:hypothetical protein
MEDPRCCGGGACIIDLEGRCWCGQVWNGQEMCFPPLASTADKPEQKAANAAQEASAG